MTAIIERQRARFYINKKQEKLRNVLYANSQTLFKKLDNYRCVFVLKKRYTIRYRVFHEIFEAGIFIQKS